MTMYRALGYVDRTALRAADDPLRVVMASEGRQADGIDLRMSGARLERYRANPVLGYGHSYYGRENLPIGRIAADSIAVEGTQLAGVLDFDQGDEFAREVERKMRDGYLSAVSIGFEVIRWEDPKSSYWTGGVAVEWELSELSVVPIGMDAKALVTSGRGGYLPQMPPLDEDDIELARQIGEYIRRQIKARTPGVPYDGGVFATKPAPELPELPAVLPPELDQTAARSLLAAFSPKEGN